MCASGGGSAGTAAGIGGQEYLTCLSRGKFHHYRGDLFTCASGGGSAGTAAEIGGQEYLMPG